MKEPVATHFRVGSVAGWERVEISNAKKAGKPCPKMATTIVEVKIHYTEKITKPNKIKTFWHTFLQ